MTKTNFIALAAALKRQMPMYVRGDDASIHAIAYHQWCHDVIAVIGVCEQINPRFRKDKFITACGVPNLITE